MLDEALRRMPHAGPMRLIEAVLSADPERVRCRASDHRGEDYPLRIDGVLHGAVLVELGAQAAAVHASLHAIGAAHAGLVLAFGNIDVRRDTVGHQGRLVATAERRALQDDSASYRFEVADEGGTIVTGELLLSMRRREG